MLESLISAYRSNILGGNWQKVVVFCRKNKLLSVGALFYLFLMFVFAIRASLSCSSTLQLITILIGFAGTYIMDHIVVKRYQYYLSQDQERLEKVASFLQTVVPSNNLFNGPQVEELITQLTERVESGAPFKKAKEMVASFIKIFVLPVVTFIAGLYTNTLQQMDPAVVVSYAVGVAILGGMLYVLIGLLLELLKKLAFRNYDAAVAFRNDLLDIKLLYFTKQNIVP